MKNIPEMSVNEVVKTLTDIYVPMIKNNLSYTTIPSPFLHGGPGVGKSDSIQQLANNLETQTGKKVIITELRLLLFSPIDLRGVPIPDVTKTFTDWLMPHILNLNPSKGVVNILFLDELSAAPQSVQAAAYQITLNHAVGEHKLPENTIVIAAGNRICDRSVASKMPAALANRMMHYSIEVNFNDWKSWALENNIHSLVLGYLSYDSRKLCVDKISADDIAFPTPRSWTFVSNILNTLETVEKIEQYSSLISSCIGIGITAEFLAWAKGKRIPNVEDIFNGKEINYIGSPDALYSLIASMSSYAKKKEVAGAGLSNYEIENVSKFCETIPPDYAAKFYAGLLTIGTLKQKLLACECFIKWIEEHENWFSTKG